MTWCVVGVVLVVVDAHADRHVGTLGGRGDDDLLGAAGQVGRGLRALGEEAGALDDHVDADVAPGQVRGVALGEDLDLLVVHVDVVVVRVDVARVAPERRVVVEQVRERPGVGDVVHRHDLDVRLAERRRPEDVPPDAAEPVDPHAYAHPSILQVAKTAANVPRRVRGGLSGSRGAPPPPARRARLPRRVRRAAAAGPRRPRRRRRRDATVRRVVDGDTLIARVGGADERVRMLGVDAPESVSPGPARRVLRPAGRGAPEGAAAARAPASTLATDPTQGAPRPLRPAAGGGPPAGDARTVNEELVAGGYAEVFRGDGRGRAAARPAGRRARGPRRRAAGCGAPAARGG